MGLRIGDQNQRIKDLLGIPAHMELITVMPFGFRDEGIKGTGRRRKPLADIAHVERFGQRYEPGSSRLP